MTDTSPRPTRDELARSIAERIDWTPTLLAGGDSRAAIVEQVLRLAEIHDAIRPRTDPSLPQRRDDPEEIRARLAALTARTPQPTVADSLGVLRRELWAVLDRDPGTDRDLVETVRNLRADVARLRARTHDIQAQEMEKRAYLDSALAELRGRWDAARRWTEDRGLMAEWAAGGGAHYPFWSMTSQHARDALATLVHAAAQTPAPQPAVPDGPTRDAVIAAVEAVMPADTVYTRDYGTVGIAPDVGDVADAVMALLPQPAVPDGEDAPSFCACTTECSGEDMSCPLARERAKGEGGEDVPARLQALADTWDRQQAAYPDTAHGRAAAAAVRLCAREVRAAVAAALARPTEREQ